MSQCCQKSYGITQGSRFRNLHGRIAITPRNLQYLRTDPLYRRLKQHTIIIAIRSVYAMEVHDTAENIKFLHEKWRKI